MIRRYLEYSGYDVRHAQNFTDIDDKIIAARQSEHIDADELAEQLIDALARRNATPQRLAGHDLSPRDAGDRPSSSR